MAHQILTDQQDVEIFRDAFNFYKKYKDPGEFRDSGIWGDMLQEANTIRNKHKGGSLVSGLLNLIYGEVYRNCPEYQGNESLFKD